jgi:Fe-S cluster assembly protein SufD
VTVAPPLAGAGLDRYRRELEALGEGTKEPSWLRARRLAAFERFKGRGFPTAREEAWRQTSVARIAGTAFSRPDPGGRGDAVAKAAGLPDLGGPTAVFVDGRFSSTLSAGEGGAGVEVTSLREALQKAPSRLEPLWTLPAEATTSAFGDLNAALHDDGAVVFLAPGAIAAKPLHLVFLSTHGNGTPFASHPRSLVVAGKGSEARIVETHLGPDGTVYLANAVTEVHVGEGASVHHYRLQREGEAAFHVGRLSVRLDRDGRFRDQSISLGASLARHDIDVTFAGEGAECSLEGLFFADGDRTTDVHTRIDHAAPHCASRELYKGILDGRGRGVFHGLVVVRPGAQKTDAMQSNKNILLSRQALVSSTPQLEILADDVKCKHGSTTGQLDPVAVFYLRSRGIGEGEARALLTSAFAGELVGKIEIGALRAAVEAELEARLARAPRAGEAA